MRTKNSLVLFVLLLLTQILSAQQIEKDWEELLTTATSPVDKAVIIDRWVDSILWHTEDYVQALSLLNQAETICHTHECGESAVRLATHKGVIQIQKGILDSFIFISPTLLEQTHQPSTQSYIYQTAGLAHFLKGKTNRGREYLQKALQLLKDNQPNNRKISQIHSTIAIYHTYTSQNDSALYYNTLALQTYKQSQDTFKIIQALIAQSIFNEALGKAEKAIEHLLSADELCENNNVFHQQLNYYIQAYLAQHYRKTNKEQALLVCTKNIEKINNDPKLNSPTKTELLWTFYNVKSSTLIKLDRPQEALTLLQASLNLPNSEVLYPSQILNTKLFKIDALIKMQQYDKAQSLLQSILLNGPLESYDSHNVKILSLHKDIYTLSNITPSLKTQNTLSQIANRVITKNEGLYNTDLLEAHQLQAIINAAQTNNPQAIKTIASINEIKDTLWNREKTSEINELLIEYKTKEQTDQLKIKDLSIAKKNNLILIYIFIIAIISLVLVALFVFLFQKRKQAQKLEKLVKLRTQELSLANKALQQSHKELERFTYIFSHDLKEPIRNIVSFSQILSNHPNTGEGQLHLLNFIDNNAQNMHLLINDTQNYLQLREQTPTYSSIHLSACLAELTKELTDNTQQLINITLFDEDISIISDKQLLCPIIKNLLDNSIKYNNNETIKIDIQYKTSQLYHIISIADNGIGISPEHYDQIFNMFTRLHNRDKYKGSGVGLAICKRLIDSLNGDIKVEKSEILGGSKFIISLPINPHSN